MTGERPQDRTLEADAARRVAGQLDVRGRGAGMWAFVAHRITGIGLVVYLLLHLFVLSLLAQGQAGWDSFIRLARTPVFLMLDVILIAGVLFHGLNGVRVAMAGVGLGVRRQKPALVVVIALAGMAFVFASLRILGE